MTEIATALSLPKWRRMALLFGVVAAFSGLFARAAYLQLMPEDKLQKETAKRFNRAKPLLAVRGKILDRNESLLAATQMLVTISASPKEIAKRKAELTRKNKTLTLARDEAKMQEMITLLGVDRAEFYSGLKNEGSTHMIVKRNVTQALAKEIKSLSVKGVHFRTTPKRHYVCGETCGHLIGKKGKENNSIRGYLGVELQFNDLLKGADGLHKVRQAKGIVLDDLEAVALAQDGKDIVLSVDYKIQHFAYEALKKGVERAKAKSGAAVVLDAKTGEVLAMATVPSFDPNNMVGYEGGFKNIAVSNNFEPGSTMKSFSVAAGLESGLFKATTKIDTNPGYLMFGKRKITDHERNGVLTVKEVVQKSSNIGTSKMAAKLGRERLWKTYKALEFGQKTKIRFPGEAAGKVNDYQDWRDVELATNSYGHGISVTLLQLARAYTVFANEGVLLPLSLQKIKRPPVGKPVFTKKTARQMQDMLLAVVSPEGTAPKAKIEGYSVAGKTGTADKINEGQGYYSNKYISSFVGMAPATNPRAIMAVMIDDPDPSGRQHYGGIVAAPVFSEAVGKTLHYLRVPKDLQPTQTVVLQNEKPDNQNKSQARAEGV